MQAIDEYDDEDSFLDNEEEDYVPVLPAERSNNGIKGFGGFAASGGGPTTTPKSGGVPKEGGGGGHAAVLSSCTWMPFHMTTYWLDGHHNSYVKVALVLPSGLSFQGLEGKITPTVGPDGKTVIITCDWPMPMYDTAYWEEGWEDEIGFNDRDLLPMIQSAEREVKAIRRHLAIKKKVAIYSTATIKLKLEVEPKILRTVPFEDGITGTQLLFILLKVHEQEDEEPGMDLDFRRHDSKLVVPRLTKVNGNNKLKANAQAKARRNDADARKSLTSTAGSCNKVQLSKRNKTADTPAKNKRKKPVSPDSDDY